MYDNQSWFTYCACCLRSSHPEMFYYIKGLLITNLSNSQECGELSFIWIKITKFLKILYFKPRITVSTLPCLSPPISLYYVILILNTLLLKEFFVLSICICKALFHFVRRPKHPWIRNRRYQSAISNPVKHLSWTFLLKAVNYFCKKAPL